MSDDADTPNVRRSKAGSSLRSRVLRMLARREHSREELKRKLGGAETVPGELDRLLDEFEKQGWLSEHRLADQAVVLARGRYGSRRVLDQLRQKGVTGEPFARALDALKAQELESAQAVWRKRFGRPAADLSEKAKQARFLAARGFAPEAIQQVLKGMFEEPD